MKSDFDTLISTCQELLKTLPEARQAREYLNSRLPQSMQDKYEFGYFPTNENIYMLDNLVGQENLAKLNVIYDKVIDNQKYRHGTLERHNLILPYKDVYGRTIGVVGRTLLSDEERKKSNIPKYKNTSFDKGANLFGLNFAKEEIINKDCVYIVEGQVDKIKSDENNFYNVVALGSSNMTAEQVVLLTRYTKNFILLLDNDEAGIAGMKKIVEKFGNYANIKRGRLPMGVKDLDELMDCGGVDGIEVI